jgi:hypothetical protein
MRAYPINSKGEKIGESKCFSAEQWERMQKIKGLAWREEIIVKTEVTELIEFKPRSVKKRKTNKNKNEE